MGFETVRIAGLKPWLAGPQAEAYEGAQGAEEDAALDTLIAAVKLRWPLPGCIDPSDDLALYHAGEHRRILRAPPEGGVSYLARLGRAPLHWYWAGTNPGLLLPFEPFFASFVPPTEELRRLDPVRDAAFVGLQVAHGRVDPLYWLAATAPSCDDVICLSNPAVDGYWDGNEAWYSRVFWLVDSQSGTPWDVDDDWDDPGDWDDGGLWDTTMTLQEATYLRAQIRRNKAPGAYPVTIAVALPGNPDDGFWGSPGTWEDGGLWGADQESDPLYITVGHVWGEEAWLGSVGDYPLTDVWGEDDEESDWVAYEGDPLQR